MTTCEELLKAVYAEEECDIPAGAVSRYSQCCTAHIGGKLPGYIHGDIQQVSHPTNLPQRLEASKVGA